MAALKDFRDDFENDLIEFCIDYYGDNYRLDIEDKCFDAEKTAIELLEAFSRGKAKNFFRTNSEYEFEEGVAPYKASSFGVSNKDFV